MSASAYSTFLQSVVRSNRAEVESVCRRYGASDVKIFGSVARGDAAPVSDIDLMVTIDGPDYEQVMSMLGLGEELTKLLGTHVDVVARGVVKDAVAENDHANAGHASHQARNPIAGAPCKTVERHSGELGESMTVNGEANPDRAVRFGNGKVEISVSTLTELLDITDQFSLALGELEPGSELDVVLKRLGAVTTSAVLPHVIDTLERNGGPGRTLPYLLEYSIGRRLEEPADRPGTNSHELNDRLYLRWLAHRTIDVDDATEAEFLRRWTARQEELNSASH